MPIITASNIIVLDQDSFHLIDHLVTGFAFDIHNEFGRFLDEELYKRELAERCRCAGLEVQAEMHIRVSFESFAKDYFVDVLLNRGVVIEVKTAECLAAAHRGQTLNYLFLCGLHHGTLLNLRPERVQHEFVSTRLTPADRKHIHVVERGWKRVSPECDLLRERLLALLEEWGAFLDTTLYRDALTDFFGGVERVLKPVDVLSKDRVIGQQELRLLANDLAFSITSVTRNPQAMLEHQRRFLQHTRLRAIAWINLNHHDIEFCIVER